MTTRARSQLEPHVHFRSTTLAQRGLLFSTVKQTDNVSEAAHRAHVGRGTYYYWLPRYTADGLAGLATERSRAPHHTRIPPLSCELQREVLTYHQAHPTEGCRTIANAINQAHAWQKVIGHTKVNELLFTPRPATPSPAPLVSTEVVHAPKPNQTVNMDLCVVPLTHTNPSDWVSVSLKEAAVGRLTETAKSAPVVEWPGQTFANQALSYEEQMRTYVLQRTAKRRSQRQRKHSRRENQAARTEWRAQRDEHRLRHRRRRLARQLEDTEWQAQRQVQRAFKRRWKTLSAQERSRRRMEQSARWADWHAAQTTRRTQRQQRAAEDAAWRQDRLMLRQQLAQLAQGVPLVTAWLAILVVVCNGTRRCLGLPLFTAGVHVTAEMIVAALTVLCPPELQFIISDNGSQFIAQAFAQFVNAHELIHVRIAPRRPCTNGIAERFVRTLKERLSTQTWTSTDELQALLKTFIAYYNNRPHQGAEFHGLSPNEFARRYYDCSRC